MKKFLQIIGLSTILSLLFVQTGFAAEVEPVASDATKLVLANLQNIIGVILSLMNVLIWPLLSMIGALMGNDLVFGPQVEDRLLLIWSQVRNLINLASVLVLIGVAIYNVFGVDNDGNYAIKKVLPKFIIGLIVVNFTFFGAKVILSSVNVLTTAIYALPNSVETNFTQLDTNILAQQNCPVLMETYPENSICLDDANFSAQAEQFFSTFSADNISFLMAMNLANISQMLNVSELVRESPTIQNVTVNILISLILYFIYALSFVVLFIVLVTRVVVLWFVIALSPLILIQIVFPEGLKSITGDFDIQDLFIKHAFAPVIIGLGMTIGYLMLDAYQLNSAASLGSSLQLGEDFANAFSAGSSGLQELMVGLAAAAVVWKVTFAAAEGTLAGDIVGTIKGAVSSAASTVAGLPSYIQWIPLPGGTGDNTTTNIASVIQTGREFVRGLQRTERLTPRTNEEFLQYVQSPTLTSTNDDLRVLRSIRNVSEVRTRLTMANFRAMLGRMDSNNVGDATARQRLNTTLTTFPPANPTDSIETYLNANPRIDRDQFYRDLAGIHRAGEYQNLNEAVRSTSSIQDLIAPPSPQTLQPVVPVDSPIVEDNETQLASLDDSLLNTPVPTPGSAPIPSDLVNPAATITQSPSVAPTPSVDSQQALTSTNTEQSDAIIDTNDSTPDQEQTEDETPPQSPFAIG